MIESLWLLLLGLGAGAYSVLVGTGGGVILVPTLLIFFDMELEMAPGTSLALVAINSVSAAAVYYRSGLVDLRSGLLFASAAVPGAVVAPFAVESVGGGTFKVLFGLVLLGLGIHMLFRLRFPSPPEVGSPDSASTASRSITTPKGQSFQYQFNEAMAVGVNFVLGFVSSFFGVGGGFLRTPLLVTAFGFPVRVAVATSLFAMAIYTTIGSAVHASLGNVDWYPTFVLVGVGLFIGSQLSARLSQRFRGVWIVRLLVLLLLAFGARLLAEAVVG